MVLGDEVKVEREKAEDGEACFVSLAAAASRARRSSRFERTNCAFPFATLLLPSVCFEPRAAKRSILRVGQVVREILCSA